MAYAADVLSLFLAPSFLPFPSWVCPSSRLTALWNTIHWCTHYPTKPGLLEQHTIDWMSEITNLKFFSFWRLEGQGRVLADLVSLKGHFLLCKHLSPPFLGGMLCPLLSLCGFYLHPYLENFQVLTSSSPHWARGSQSSVCVCVGGGTFVCSFPDLIMVSRLRFLLL